MRIRFIKGVAQPIIIERQALEPEVAAPLLLNGSMEFAGAVLGAMGRAEAEKVSMINRLAKMTPEEKKVELMKKRLGLGDWAVGGTKAIYQYDPEQYERERAQRSEMGLAEFGGVPGGADDYGGGGEGGYDNDQMAADDY
jgi:hypothetical protein